VPDRSTRATRIVILFFLFVAASVHPITLLPLSARPGRLNVFGLSNSRDPVLSPTHIEDDDDDDDDDEVLLRYTVSALDYTKYNSRSTDIAIL
jgi:hypothetical protein